MIEAGNLRSIVVKTALNLVAQGAHPGEFRFPRTPTTRAFRRPGPAEGHIDQWR
ncbi:hypothetical protein XM38_025360 [Halomicronema hongdechloris C2206]|uniref:Uncharacterized protein n=1 Tax=Halomicronema hongdechloris C2206 TaxID=1641165 RepID=A0A1Z3HMP6_9CYAN|nr:hypothetical protein XM38_025360 [Halomicronema hongdechloris C2206]